MLSRNDQVILENVSENSLMELIPIFKRTRQDLFTFYLQRYRQILGKLEDERARRLLEAFLEHLESFHEAYLESAVCWDSAYLGAMSEKEKHLQKRLMQTLEPSPISLSAAC